WARKAQQSARVGADCPFNIPATLRQAPEPIGVLARITRFFAEWTVNLPDEFVLHCTPESNLHGDFREVARA
ncbi:MAG: hypothetical protein AAF809_07010, partial [Bacteroidota bacterium]